MGEQGFQIEGKWINKHTGQTIIVTQAVMYGDEMQLKLSDGRMIGMDQFQEYVQVTDDEYDLQGNKIGKAKEDPQIVVEEVRQEQPVKIQNNFSLDEPFDTITQTHSQNSKNNKQINQKKEVKRNSTKDEIIEKILAKNSPKISLTVDWAEPPFAELKMLNEYFDITTDDITEYIMKNYQIDTEDAKLKINEIINN